MLKQHEMKQMLPLLFQVVTETTEPWIERGLFAYQVGSRETVLHSSAAFCQNYAVHFFFLSRVLFIKK